IGKSALRSGRPPTSTMKRRLISIAVRKASWCHGWGESLPTDVSTTRAPASLCNACPVKGQCTRSHQGRRVYRYVGEEYLERVRSYQHTFAYQKALRKRKVWVEPLFAEAKDWHGLRRFRLRLLWRVNFEAFRIAAAQKARVGTSPVPNGGLLCLFLGPFASCACPHGGEGVVPG